MRLQQPIWPRFLPTHVVLAMARLGPVGRRLPAPGTWGSMAGLLYFTVFFYPLGENGRVAGIIATLLLSAVACYLAIALCGEAEFRLGRKDPGEVILDEFVVMPLCFLDWRTLARPIGPLPAWAVLLVGFALFRLFDILKPFGIRRLQALPGGWGVVMDDVAAALTTCAVMHVGNQIWLYARH